MHRATTKTKRLMWLLTNELKLKKNQYLLIVLTAFAALTYLFFNPTFSFSGMIDSLLNPSSVVTTNGRTIMYFGNGMTIPKVDLKFHLDFFPNALLIVGSIITSLSFIEYNSESSRRFHISLPAKSTEKWIVKVMWSLVIFPLLFLLLYHLFALITYSWGTGMGKEYVKISFLDIYIWRYMFLHFVLQSFIIAASSFFRKYAAIKVLLSGLAFYLFTIAMRNILVFSFFPGHDIEKMGGFFSPVGWKSYLLGAQLNASDITLKYPSIFNDYFYGILGVSIFIGTLYLSYCRFSEYEA
ncbi:MAG: hypothetical protein P8M34_05980 [Saprospiraceae bacterium]|nr:hypothetical protein [Saprospiraceae bacterium]|tara:strand:- start:12592 stop:13482 length:891 start_codon:yes stop_codon:yes gene_type:complete